MAVLLHERPQTAGGKTRKTPNLPKISAVVALFAFSSRLDLGATGGRQEIEIPLAGGKSVRLKVKENRRCRPRRQREDRRLRPGDGEDHLDSGAGEGDPPL